jgi:hypothetical protein
MWFPWTGPLRDPLGWTTCPVTHVDDEKTLLSGGFEFSDYSSDDLFE